MKNHKTIFISHLENKLKRKIEIPYPLNKLLDHAVDSCERVTINRTKAYELCNEFEFLCFIKRQWKEYFDILSASHLGNKGVSLTVMGVQLPLSEEHLTLSNKIFQEIDSKCDFKYFDLDSLVDKEML